MEKPLQEIKYSVTFWLWSSVLLTIFLALVKFHWGRRNMYRLAAKLPGPPTIPLFGNAHLVIGKNVKGVTKTLLKFWNNDFEGTKLPIRIWLGPVLFIILTTPEDVQIALNALETSEKSYTYKIVKPLLGNSLIDKPVWEWKHLRKYFSPMFTKKACDNYVTIYNSKCDTLISTLKQKSVWPDDDLHTHTFSYAMDCIIATLTITNLLDYGKYAFFKKEVEKTNKRCFIRITKFWLISDVIFNLTKTSKRIKESMLNVEKEIHNKIISQRIMDEKVEHETNIEHPTIIEEDEEYTDKCLLDILLELESEGKITAQEMRDNLTLMFASSETSGSLVFNVLMLLSIHKEVQAKAFKEVHDMFGESDRPIEPVDVENMVYLEMVLKETLRLFVELSNLSRYVTHDLKLSNCTIPAGAVCSINPQLIHISPDLWPEPKKFDPDRFLPENSKTRHYYSFIPFSAGPRNCIGNKFTMVMVKTVVAKILLNFSLHTEAKLSDIKFEIAIFTKFRCHKPIVLTQRK